MTEKRPTRRRWFQFSLRTLLVVIMLVAFGGGWLGMQLQQKRRHEAVVNEITKLGGSVEFLNGGDVPKWKKWIFGSYALRPVGLDLSHTDASDSLLSQSRWMNLYAVDLSSSKVTVAGLTHLKGMANLQELVLSETQITDAELTHLRGLTNLGILDLYNTQVTDAGLTHLKELTSLRLIDLRNTQATDAGVDSLLKAIPKCAINF